MSEIQEDQFLTELAHIDEETYSLYSLVSDRLKFEIRHLPLDLFDLELGALEKLHPSRKWTATDSKIRVNFWKEYERATGTGTQISNAKIINGVCTQGYFYNQFLKDKARLVYMLTPLPKDEATYEELGYLANDKLRELLTMDYIVDSTGKPCPKTAAVVLKAVELALNRSKGAVLQVIHQKNLNMNLNQDVSTTGRPIDKSPKTIEEIDRELALLEAKKADVAPFAIDEPIEVDHIVIHENT